MMQMAKAKIPLLVVFLTGLLALYTVIEIARSQVDPEGWERGFADPGSKMDEAIRHALANHPLDIPTRDGGKKTITLQLDRLRDVKHLDRDMVMSLRFKLDTDQGRFLVEVSLNYHGMDGGGKWAGNMTVDKITRLD